MIQAKGKNKVCFRRATLKAGIPYALDVPMRIPVYTYRAVCFPVELFFMLNKCPGLNSKSGDHSPVSVHPSAG